VILVSLAFATQVHSQEDRTLAWHLNAGYSATTGRTSDFLDGGWIIGGGLTWKPWQDRPFGLLAEINYSRYDATNQLIQLANLQQDTVRIDDGDTEIWSFNVNGVYKIPFNTWSRGYVTAGIGEYYRNVEMTQTVLLGGFYCDPWWGFCYPGVFPGDAIVSSQSTTRFAWNAGIGVEFPLAYGSWFIDARYHRIETSEPTEFIPIQVGFRF